MSPCWAFHQIFVQISEKEHFSNYSSWEWDENRLDYKHHNDFLEHHDFLSLQYVVVDVMNIYIKLEEGTIHIVAINGQSEKINWELSIMQKLHLLKDN